MVHGHEKPHVSFLFFFAAFCLQKTTAGLVASPVGDNVSCSSVERLGFMWQLRHYAHVTVSCSIRAKWISVSSIIDPRPLIDPRLA